MERYQSPVPAPDLLLLLPHLLQTVPVLRVRSQLGEQLDVLEVVKAVEDRAQHELWSGVSPAPRKQGEQED